MALIDWIVLSLTLISIVAYGTWKTRGNANAQDYLKGGNTTKWWTIGLSVMATQASAITFLSTPGQAFHSGMGFIQFYFGLPIAMIIICMVFIPIYHRMNVYTAYEILENRFNPETRTLTAIFFLIQRGLAAGLTIFAPAIILSVVLGWNLTLLNIIIGILVIIYTVSGGTKAVTVTQKQQMAVIFTGMFIAFFLIISYLPDNVSFSKALQIAGISGKMDVLNFSFDLENRYTVWTGLIGGTFLALSYFGTDQSQVQRYLSGKSAKEMQLGLVFNGLLKVPMQFFILLVGVMVFVFYQFNASPINFNPLGIETVKSSSFKNEFESLEQQYKTTFKNKQTYLTDFINSGSNTNSNALLANENKSIELREKAKELIDKAAKEQQVKVESNDKDYVFIQFILKYLPKGLIGLLLAVILSAAMSSTASELNALATTTTIDLYTRNKSVSDTQKVSLTKWFTLAWGILAIIVACIAHLADNLIQLVNIVGSIFYGNVLGIFLLAFFFKQIKGRAVFNAALITQVLVIGIWWIDIIPYLWLNVVGCTLVMLIAFVFEQFTKQNA